MFHAMQMSALKNYRGLDRYFKMLVKTGGRESKKLIDTPNIEKKRYESQE
jgi:hypothetical protein